jgi:hypothetical protein
MEANLFERRRVHQSSSQHAGLLKPTASMVDNAQTMRSASDDRVDTAQCGVVRREVVTEKAWVENGCCLRIASFGHAAT